MSADEMIAVIQAHKDGKQIECRATPLGLRCDPRGSGFSEWKTPYNDPPKFSFGYFDYRVKPEPREWWLIKCQLIDGGKLHVHTSGSKPVQCSGCIERIHVREVLE